MLSRTVFFWKSLLSEENNDGGVGERARFATDKILNGGSGSLNGKSTAEVTAEAVSEFGIAAMVAQITVSADLDLVEKCLEMLTTLIQVAPGSIDAGTVDLIEAQLNDPIKARLQALRNDGDDIAEAESMLHKLADALHQLHK
eukprot:jgi/Hompol1/5994/HPOL_000159-RA